MENSLPTIIPVVDIQDGIAVRAIGGDRANYRPLKSVWTDSVDPVEVARALWNAYRPPAIYIADLDAIAGQPNDDSLLPRLAEAGIRVWLDAGIRGAGDAARYAAADRLVLGSETVAGPDQLKAIVAEVGARRALFSLDMRNGTAIGDWKGDPDSIARTALAMGLDSLILLDLARVGTGGGIGTAELAGRLLADHPGLNLYLGGGIATLADVERLKRAGVAGVLIASALHDGRIGPPASLTPRNP